MLPLATKWLILALTVTAMSCKAAPPEPQEKPTGQALGHALWFDGLADYVRVDKWFNAQPGAFCIEAWVKPAESNPFDSQASFVIHRATNNTHQLTFDWEKYAYAFVAGAGSETPYYLNTGRKVTTGGWHHVAVVYDGKAIILYVNGDETSRTVAGRAPNWTVGPMGSFIGGDPLPRAVGQGFRGLIDEVRIWSVARTAEEIRASMNGAVSSNTAGLSACWSFDEGDGQQARDLTPNRHDAQLGSTPGNDRNDPVWVRSDSPVGGADRVGPAGHAFWFDGRETALQCGPLPALRGASAVTVEGWVCPSAASSSGTLVAWGGAAKGLALVLGVLTDERYGTAASARGPGHEQVSILLKPSTWRHVAYVCANKEVVIYIDGRQVARTEVSDLQGTYDQPLFIGARHDGSAAFGGELDELRIWSAARTEDQIRQAMHVAVDPAEQGLVAYWRFDEGDGQFARDLSPSGAHAQRGEMIYPDQKDPQWRVSTAPLKTAAAPKAVAASAEGGALGFDGADDFMDMGNAPELRLAGPVTVEAWIRAEDIQGEHPIVAKENSRSHQNAYELQIKGAIVRFLVSDGSAGCCGDQGWFPAAGKTKIEPNVWHHVAGVYDMNQISVYLDGVLDGMLPFNRPIINVPVMVKLGVNSEVPPYRFFHGQIDEVRLWKRARKQEEILRDMNAGLRGDEEGLIAYWTFDEPFNKDSPPSAPSSRFVLDHSRHNNHGVLGGPAPGSNLPRRVPSGAPVVPAERSGSAP